MMSTSNEWPQQKQQLHDDDIHVHHKSKTLIMPPSSSSSMEKTTNQAPPTAAADLHPLKCPRCDSSNTKFCYYNNYSLSQPRHFCKACKRYWTRGGTLRNVPVGGGCRKNKKLRRSTTSGGSSGGGGGGNGGNGSSASANPSSISSTALAQARSDLNTSSLFYSPLELNFPFSSYNSTTRVSSSDHHDSSTRFDHLQVHQPQMSNGLGLGFSSDGFIRQVQDGFPGNSNNNNNSNSIFFGSSTSTMASLLASSLQHQKFGINNTTTASKNIQGYNNEDTQMLGGNNNNNGGGNGSGWSVNPGPNEQISDPSSLLWNATSLGGWFDPSSNMGSSSVPSLI